MTEVEDGASLSEAVRKAYENGYTEPDPRDDLSGMDVARKALILARTLGISVNMEDISLESFFTEELSDSNPDVFIENLKTIDGKFQDRINRAKENKAVLRYVARLSREKVSVGIEEILLESPLAQLRGTANQVTIRTRRYDEKNPLIVTGPGAGADVTAAGVLNDIIAIAASQRGFNGIC